MNVTPFPTPRAALVQPVVQILGPLVSASGLYEVLIWKNRERNEGYQVNVPTHKAAMKVLRIVKQSFKGAAHG